MGKHFSEGEMFTPCLVAHGRVENKLFRLPFLHSSNYLSRLCDDGLLG